MLIKKGSTVDVAFVLVDDKDYVTRLANVTIGDITVKIRRSDSSAFYTPAGTVTNLGSGYYSIALDATDTAALGQLIIDVSAPGALPWGDPGNQVVEALPGEDITLTSADVERIAAKVLTISTADAKANAEADPVDSSHVYNLAQAMYALVSKVDATGGTIQIYDETGQVVNTRTVTTVANPLNIGAVE